MFNLNVCIIRANPYLNGSYTESTARIGYTLQTFLLVVAHKKMKDWTEIKNRILFSYMGCDWTSISVGKKEAGQIREYLEKIVNLEKTSDNIFKFDNSGTEVYFYLNSDQHFDFDPKTISSAEQWNKFLETFIRISKDMESEVLFRPEDSNPRENITVKIINDNVDYDFDVYEAYRE